MNIPRAILFAFIASISALHGQPGEGQPPAPEMDQIAVKPARACWVETQCGRKEQPSADYPVKTLRLVFDGTEYSETTLADGKTTKRWKAGQITVASAMIEGHEEVFIDYINFFPLTPVKVKGGERFQGLEWIALKNYRGHSNQGGTACWYFDSSATASSGQKLAPGRKAWIDIQTGLPVAYSENGTQIVFHFETPPTAPVPCSPAVQSFLKRYREAMSRYSPGEVR